MGIVSRKNKDGSYTYQVRERDINGKQVSFSFDKKGDAKALEAQLKVNKNKNVPLASPGKKITLNEFWDNWFTRSNTATDGWKYSQNQMYRDYIKPHTGNLSLSNIKPPHISDIFIKMEKLGRAEQTRKHVYNLLHKIFEDCIEDYNYLTENPVKYKFLPKVIIKDSEYLDYDEVKVLLLNVRGKRYGLGIWIQLFLGLRIGEVVYLRWEHIDFRTGMLHIRGTYRRKEKRLVDHPKGEDWHSVKIPKELIHYLKEEKEKGRSEWVQPSESYFQNHLNCKTYSDNLKKYVKDAGVSQKISSHCLRHSTHSVLMFHGATEEDMKKLFDHASKETTDRYIHDGHKPETRLQKVIDQVKVFE